MSSKKIDVEQLIPKRLETTPKVEQVEPPPSPGRSELEPHYELQPEPQPEPPIPHFPLKLLPRSAPEAGPKRSVTIWLPKHTVKAGTVEVIVPKRCKMRGEYMLETQDCPRPLVVKPVRALPQMVYARWTAEHSKVKLPVKQNTVVVEVEDMSYAPTIPRPLDDREEPPQIYVRVVEDDSLLPVKQVLPRRLSWNSALPKPAFKLDLAPKDVGMEPRMAELLPGKSVISWSPEQLMHTGSEDSPASDAPASDVLASVDQASDAPASDAPAPDPAAATTELMPRRCVMNTEKKFGITLPLEHDEPKVWKPQAGASLPRCCTCLVSAN